MSSKRQRRIPLGGRYRQVSLYMPYPMNSETNMLREWLVPKILVMYFLLQNKVHHGVNPSLVTQLQWRHNGHGCISNHQTHDCFYSTGYATANKKAKLRVAVLCEGISLVTGEIPAQRASNAEYVFIWWRHDTNTCTLLLRCLKKRYRDRDVSFIRYTYIEYGPWNIDTAWLCFVLMFYNQFCVDLCHLFNDILQGCFTGTVVFVPYASDVTLKDMSKTGRFLITTKHKIVQSAYKVYGHTVSYMINFKS